MSLFESDQHPSLRRFVFLQLPEKARQLIYCHLFNAIHPLPLTHDLKLHHIPSFSTSSSHTRSAKPIPIAILRTCNTIHKEALPALFHHEMAFSSTLNCDISLSTGAYADYLKKNITSIRVNACTEDGICQLTSTLLFCPNLRHLHFRIGDDEDYLDVTINSRGELDTVYCFDGIVQKRSVLEVYGTLFSDHVMPFVSTIQEHMKGKF